MDADQVRKVTMDYVWAALLVVVSVLGWSANLLGLPGNWLSVVASAMYAQFGPAAGRPDVGWGVVAALAVLALVGEAIELLAAMVGTKKAGGSKRGAALALAGSMIGGLIGMVIGVPIPVVGPLVAAVLFGALGALGGAVLGERWKGRDTDDSFRVGEAAFWGRLFGTLGKSLIGTLMVILVLAAVLF